MQYNLFVVQNMNGKRYAMNNEIININEREKGRKKDK